MQKLIAASRGNSKSARAEGVRVEYTARWWQHLTKPSMTKKGTSLSCGQCLLKSFKFNEHGHGLDEWLQHLSRFDSLVTNSTCREFYYTLSTTHTHSFASNQELSNTGQLNAGQLKTQNHNNLWPYTFAQMTVPVHVIMAHQLLASQLGQCAFKGSPLSRC